MNHKDRFPGYQCSLCGEKYAAEESIYTCSKDGGNLDIMLDFDKIRRTTSPELIRAAQEHSLWRYLPLLPVGEPEGYLTPIRSAGWTPQFCPTELRAKLNLRFLWIKDESYNPTA